MRTSWPCPGLMRLIFLMLQFASASLPLLLPLNLSLSLSLLLTLLPRALFVVCTSPAHFFQALNFISRSAFA